MNEWDVRGLVNRAEESGPTGLAGSAKFGAAPRQPSILARLGSNALAFGAAVCLWGSFSWGTMAQEPTESSTPAAGEEVRIIQQPLDAPPPAPPEDSAAVVDDGASPTTSDEPTTVDDSSPMTQEGDPSAATDGGSEGEEPLAVELIELPHPFDQLTLTPPRYALQPLSPAEEEATRQKFEEVANRVRGILGEMLDTRIAFDFAVDRYELAEAQSRWLELKFEGEMRFLELQDLALKIFVSNPSKDSLMYRIVRDGVYEDAFQGRMWSAYNGITILRRTVGIDETMEPVAAVAAFRCSQFEEFAKYISFTNPDDLDDKHKEILPIFEYVAAHWQRELRFRHAEAIADDLPRVRMTTTKGVIEIELFENEAPNTVANFISLIEADYYTDLPFHRVIAGFMAQGGETGDPNGPGYRIPCECYDENARVHFMGSLSVAHAGRDTGGAQFFISYGPQPHLDGQHTVFGRVISGIEFAERLARIDPENLQGNEIPDRILSMQVIRKRPHEYTVRTLPLP